VPILNSNSFTTSRFAIQLVVMHYDSANVVISMCNATVNASANVINHCLHQLTSSLNNFPALSVASNHCEMDSPRGFSGSGIDYAHCRTLKTPSPIQGRSRCIEAKMNQNSNFRMKTGGLGVFLVGESIAPIPLNTCNTELNVFLTHNTNCVPTGSKNLAKRLFC
jgi:hypothetical protein